MTMFGVWTSGVGAADDVDRNLISLETLRQPFELPIATNWNRRSLKVPKAGSHLGR